MCIACGHLRYAKTEANTGVQSRFILQTVELAIGLRARHGDDHREGGRVQASGTMTVTR
jgi:hypothetical protein